jgi:hypothetical protein
MTQPPAENRSKWLGLVASMADMANRKREVYQFIVSGGAYVVDPVLSMARAQIGR